MRRIPSLHPTKPSHPMDFIDLAAKYADLKQDHYKLTLALTAALELLTEKGILTERELQDKAAALDVLSL